MIIVFICIYDYHTHYRNIAKCTVAEMTRKIGCLILAGMLVCVQAVADAPLGNLFGANSDLDVVYKGDIMASLSGGLRRGATYLDSLDIKLTLDAQQLFGWTGTTIFLHGLSNHGGRPNAHYARSAQGIDNIEVTANTAKLYQAWIQRALWNDRVSVLTGLYDLNSEFYITDTSTLFLHPAPGIGSEFAQSGVNGPSVFPNTSVAFRVRAQPSPDYYIQAAILDGVPGDPNNPKGTHIQFNKGDGALLIAEAAYLRGYQGQAMLSDRDRDNKMHEPFGKYAMGVWHYTAKFDDLIETDSEGKSARRGNNSGLYFIAEQSVYQEPGDSSQGVNAFVRYGIANSDINRFVHYLNVGAVYTGIIPGRNHDQLGISFGSAHNGAKYRRARLSEGVVSDHDEIGLEITYRAAVFSWLAVQPTIQYIVNPNTDPQLGDAVMLGVRFEASLDE